MTPSHGAAPATRDEQLAAIFAELKNIRLQMVVFQSSISEVRAMNIENTKFREGIETGYTWIRRCGLAIVMICGAAAGVVNAFNGYMHFKHK